MNADKLRKLFELTRSEPSPVAPAGFADDVMRAVRQSSRPDPLSVFGQLGELFPRLAVAAALVIVLFVAADFCAASIDQSDVTGAVSQLSDQWLFATKGF